MQICCLKKNETVTPLSGIYFENNKIYGEVNINYNMYIKSLIVSKSRNVCDKESNTPENIRKLLYKYQSQI